MSRSVTQLTPFQLSDLGDLGNLLLTLKLKQDLVWSGKSGDTGDSDESSDSGESGNQDDTDNTSDFGESGN